MNLLRDYKRDGIVVVRNALDEELIEKVMTDWKSLFRKQIKRHNINEGTFKENLFKLFEVDNTAFKNSGKLCYGLRSLFKLASCPLVKNLVQLLGVQEPVHNTRPVILVNSNRTALHEDYARYPAHQDWRSSQGSLNSIVVWCNLTKVEKRHGPLEFIRGSHRWGLLDADDENYTTVPPIKHQFSDELWENTGTMNVGDVVLFSTFLVHRSGEIKNDNIRWSASFRFNDIQEEEYINRGFVEPYTYRGAEKLITDGYPSEELLSETFNKLKGRE